MKPVSCPIFYSVASAIPPPRPVLRGKEGIPSCVHVYALSLSLLCRVMTPPDEIEGEGEGRGGQGRFADASENESMRRRRRRRIDKDDLAVSSEGKKGMPSTARLQAFSISGHTMYYMSYERLKMYVCLLLS